MSSNNARGVSTHRQYAAPNRYLLAPILVLLAACHVDPPPLPGEEWGPEQTMRVLRAAGEYSSPNEMLAPEGAALRAVNVVVDDPGKYATHKGLFNPASTGNVQAGHPLSSFTLYQGAIIAHSQADGTLSRLQGNTWSDIDGTYFTPDGLPMSFLEQQGSLFFTTTNGLYRLDGVAASPVPSGLPQALPGLATLTGSTGFLDGGEAVVYRANWAVKVDTGGDTSRLVEGAPSPRLLVSNTNAAGTFRDVAISFPIPDNLPPGAFLRVFRADIVPNTISPTDEVRQVFERAPTTQETSDRIFAFTDDTPDTVKGAGAYYSANSGEGIAQSNYQAPLVRGCAAFAESAFGIGIDGVQRLTLHMLGAVAVGQGIMFIPPVGGSETYTAGAAEAFPDTFKTFAGSSTPAQDLANTVASLVRAINSRSGGLLRAFALDTDGSSPGAFLVERRTLSQEQIAAYSVGNPQSWTPALPTFGNGTYARAPASSNVVVTTTYVHGLEVNRTVNITSTGNVDFATGAKVITAVTATTFTYVEVGPSGSGSLTYETTDVPVTTDDGLALNAYAWSKQGEPDHWPLANLATVGGALERLWWGQSLDRYLFLGSDGGLFRINGTATDGFSNPEQGSPWDSNVRFLGRRNVAALDGEVFALAQEGIVGWSESSKPQAVDTAIQQEIRTAVLNYPDKVAELGFFVADGLNHRLYVALPESSTATAATKLHVLNMKSGGAWTRLTSTFPGLSEGAVAGTAPPDGNGALYLLPGAQETNEGVLYASRNTGTLEDYQGPDGEGIPAKVTYLPWVAGEPERMKQWTWTRLFTSNVSAIQYCYATDLVPAEECQSLPSMDPERTTPVPVTDPIRSLAWKTIVGAATDGTSKQRARSLSVSVGHSEPLEMFELLGAEVAHRAYGKGQ